MRVRTAIGLVVIVLAAHEVGAQEETSNHLSMLSSGDRVRLRFADSGDRLRATVESVTADELVLRKADSAEPLRLSLAQLESLDVAQGRRSQWRKGAVIGLIPGAISFGLAGAAASCADSSTCEYAPGVGLVAAVIGGASTGSIGALIGLAFKTDRWVRVHERKPKVGLMLVPIKGDLRAGITLSF